MALSTQQSFLITTRVHRCRKCQVQREAYAFPSLRVEQNIAKRFLNYFSNIVRQLENEEAAAREKAAKKKQIRKSKQKADRLRGERSGKKRK